MSEGMPGTSREQLAERLARTIDQLRQVQGDLLGLLEDLDQEHEQEEAEGCG